MQVVTDEGHAHAEARHQGLTLVGDTIIVLVRQLPEVRDAGEINAVILGQHGEADAIQRLMKLIAEQRAMIRRAIAIAILQTNQPVGGVGEEALRETTRDGGIQFCTVLHRLRLEVATDELIHPAQVRHALPEAIHLGNEKPTLTIHAEAARVLDKGKPHPRLPMQPIMFHHA